jgi:hypothetical protein
MDLLTLIYYYYVIVEHKAYKDLIGLCLAVVDVRGRTSICKSDAFGNVITGRGVECKGNLESMESIESGKHILCSHNILNRTSCLSHYRYKNSCVQSRHSRCRIWRCPWIRSWTLPLPWTLSLELDEK